MAELNICRGNLLAAKEREEGGKEEREDRSVMDDDGPAPL